MDADVRRELDYVKGGASFVAGEVTLAVAPATTTTVTRRGCSASSAVSLTPYNSAARTEGIPQCVPSSTGFVLTHSSSAGSRIYRYVVHTPTT